MGEFSLRLAAVVCCLLFSGVIGTATAEMDEALFPEQDTVNRMLLEDRPEGFLFLVMEDDAEALQWVLPRILHYAGQFKAVWPDLPLAVLSHGEEMMGLLSEYAPLYPQMHDNLRRLIEEFDASFHVCGAYAAMSGVAASEFPDYVDVVPFGPAEIENYRLMEYAVLSVELTW
jgi:hypothetical protein